jgi:putative Mn2+ efflux pump MntP
MNKYLIQLLLNIIFLLIIILGCFYLYSPCNNDLENKAASKSQFIYKQF